MSPPHPPPVEGPYTTCALLALRDPALVGPLAQAIQRTGLVSMLAFDAKQVRARLRDQPTDIAVVLLDTQLAPGRTDDLVAVIRAHTRAGILVLSPGPNAARGGDTLPLEAPVEAIAARARALAQAHRGNGATPVLRWGDLHIDPAARTATIGRVPLALTPSQFAVLSRLVEAAGSVVGIEQIASAIYGRGHPLDSQRVRAHMVRLRRAMRAVRPQTADLLVTVRSEGYRLVRPEERALRRPGARDVGPAVVRLRPGADRVDSEG